jgi:hypothetical protein
MRDILILGTDRHTFTIIIGFWFGKGETSIKRCQDILTTVNRFLGFIDRRATISAFLFG